MSSSLFPLYPDLSEEGRQEAQLLIDNFKLKLKEVAESVISDLYCDAADFIESDSWCNFRNTLMAGFRNYANRHRQNEWDFAEIRAEIFKQFHDDIIDDLNQDIVEENEELKREVDRLKKIIRNGKNYY